MRLDYRKPCGCFSYDTNEGMRAFCIVEMVKKENNIVEFLFDFDIYLCEMSSSKLWSVQDYLKQNIFSNWQFLALFNLIVALSKIPVVDHWVAGYYDSEVAFKSNQILLYFLRTFIYNICGADELYHYTVLFY